MAAYRVNFNGQQVSETLLSRSHVRTYLSSCNPDASVRVQKWVGDDHPDGWEIVRWSDLYEHGEVPGWCHHPLTA